MPTLDATLDAYANPIQWDQLNEVLVLSLRNNFVVSGQEDGAALVPLGLALREPWEGDLHFAQYWSESERREKKAAHGPVTFTCAVFDLDWEHHKTKEPPTRGNFLDLVRVCDIMDHASGGSIKPNIVYPTRNGARLIYLINPITSPENFEVLRANLGKKIDFFFCRRKGPFYRLDPLTSDWTRLFRAPRVVRQHDDGSKTDLRYTEVRVFHTRKLGFSRDEKIVEMIRKVEGRRPTKPTKPGSAPIQAVPHDRKLEVMRNKMRVVGQRNHYLLAAAWHICATYEPDAAEELIDQLRAEAIDNGLDRSEVDNTIASAKSKAVRCE